MIYQKAALFTSPYIPDDCNCFRLLIFTCVIYDLGKITNRWFEIRNIFMTSKFIYTSFNKTNE